MSSECSPLVINHNHCVSLRHHHRSPVVAISQTVLFVRLRAAILGRNQLYVAAVHHTTNRCVVPTITPHPPMCICCHLCHIGAPNRCVVPAITPPSPDVHLLPSLPYWRPNRCVVPTILSPSHPVCNLYAFDKRSRFACHHHPIFFLFEKNSMTTQSAAKRDLGVASQGEIHPCTSSTLDRSTGRFEAMPHSFVWPLKRVPLLNCHVDHDRPSSVCPSPRYREVWRQKAFLSPLG
jgi:hypothetical protein